MNANIFNEMNQRTETRFWINNPSFTEMELAIEHGAVNCTTNPAYCARLLFVESDFMQELIDKTIFSISDYDEIALHIYRMSSKQLMDRFMTLYSKSDGKEGFVTLQDDPRKDQDAEYVIGNIVKNRGLSENYMAKIPVIEGGIEAIDFCVRNNVPICATEVFSVAQALHICQTYSKASTESGKSPVMYVTHISGIFDDYLSRVVKREGIKIDPAIISQAGIAIARKEYALLNKLGFKMLGGGARGPHHFLDLVGGNAHITINWSTAEEIMSSNDHIVDSIENETPVEVISELIEKLPDFRVAYSTNGLKVSEYADYGPVQMFRNAFLKGWYQLLAEIASRKNYWGV